jgi:multiple sugar transport system ATP-binding protein
LAEVGLREIEKSYGTVEAIRGVDLSIPDGEFTVLVGPSGCGKSTLLRIIAGLEEVDRGTVEIAGQVVNGVRPKDRDIAMVFQNYALYPYMKVYDNISFGLRVRKMPDAEIRRRVEEATGLLGISHLLDRFPRQLSGGERQRVAMGRALVRDARLYLLDEPLSNLDAQLRDDMRTEIKRLHQVMGKTMIYVTHDQVEAMTLADRIVLLNQGKVEQVGAPIELYERPDTRFVAGFLGSPAMNFVEAEIVEAEGSLALRVGGLTDLALPPARKESLAAQVGRTVVFGVRPEHLNKARGEPGVDTAILPIKVELVEPTGSRTFVNFDLHGHSMLAELGPGEVKGPDEAFDLHVDMNRAIVIDPESQRVLH